jgi:hypothetical protein
LRALSFTYCPIESRFIDCAEDARAYYHFKLVGLGPHVIEVFGKVRVTVRFNAEEIHPFTTEKPIVGAEQLARPGKHASEIRYFDRERARRLDQILETLTNPARAIRAKDPRAVCVYGPPREGAQRMCVIVGPEGASGCWYVRTAYPVSADAFRNALQNTGGKGSKWPP